MTKEKYIEIRTSYGIHSMCMPEDKVIEEMTEKECHEMCKAVIKLFTKTIPKRVKKIKEEW